MLWHVTGLGLVLALSGCGGALALHAPTVARSQGREAATPLDLDALVLSPRDDAAPGFQGSPEIMLTSAIAAELKGRAITGGEPGGYVVRCSLERLALRERGGLAVLYVDLLCSAARRHDGAMVWRGALRARVAGTRAAPLTSSPGTRQQQVDRLFSDAARELSADLVLRALALRAGPSVRVFADEAEQLATAGLDDGPAGGTALAEDRTAAAKLLPAAGDEAARAGAWNAVAMAAGPDEPASPAPLDTAPWVRFHQLKALARSASPDSLCSLMSAVAREDHPLLAEMLRDAVASGGIGLARSRRP